MKRSSALLTGIIKINSAGMHNQDDMLAAEEPLEIRISFYDSMQRMQKSISVTMRTPGNDFELATGFLFTEGIIKNVNDINTIKHCNGLHENVVRVELKDHVEVELRKLERNFYTTSSCGVCGKSSIEAVKTVRRLSASKNDELRFSPDIIYSLPAVLRSRQDVFDFTGGLHACGLFDTSGNLLISREDVGRHNALDKLIGAVLKQPSISFDTSLLLLSGRASFELIQKAYMAGIKFVAAVGAPSSLAVQMAEEFGITLIGFLRNKSFNIYTGAQRITILKNENSYQG
ncbi:MAG: formate dehydrogenase accessory sulfurtransferase FdhD [Segetibacter sp.]|nr:formate dehydrogenase accessory sulfurtransferase FdhD [Segetibacter sp.]